MLASLRAGFIAALVILAPLSALAADKPFKNDDLADAAIKLEAQIKEDAGTVAKPLATLRREADAAFAKNDFRGGMQVLAQIVAVAPQDAANWIRLSRTILQIRTVNDDERRNFLERAAAAAYIAYQRAGNRNEEADALVLLGRTFADRRQWRPALDAFRLSLELREVADVRGVYEQIRADNGFRVLDYTVDNDSASPRACFQFSEELPGEARRLLAVRRGRRPGQAGALGRFQAALRRGPQARRALFGHAARRTAVGGAREPRQSPPTSRSMCATAARSRASPARPMCCRAPASAGSRWSASTPTR